ncbi:ATP-binding protein, partial [Paenibacillus naphthalenovorans]|uniref:ATP-binding protein n=1 Tax=Paenibacillus naphthalenovorans TaxID=162209 RepID=UPI00088CD3FA
MNETIVHLKQSLKTLNLTEAAQIVDESLMEAEEHQWTCREFLQRLLRYELVRREEKQLARRYKWASFPEVKTLDEFRLEEQPSLSKRQFQQLRELLWLEQNYNLILLGPPGVGNYRKNLVMERIERTSRYFNECTLISFHNTSE